MRTRLNLIICAFTVQFAVSCSAPLPEQCKQLIAVEKFSVNQKDPVLSKQFELFSSEYATRTKDIDKLSISDSFLKSTQQKLVQNYNELSKNFMDQANQSKQLELIEQNPPSNEREKLAQLEKVIQLSEQTREFSKQSSNNLLAIDTLFSDAKKFCQKQ